jgi:long-chain acyl-CoA synthetase
MGHRLVLMDKWLPEAMLALIELHRVNSVQLVPIMFHRLLALTDAQRRSYRLDSLECVIHAAAPCPVKTKRQMIDWWGPVIHEYYAASEGGGTHVTAADWLARPGTVGRAYPHSEVRILDEQGRNLPAGEVGLVYMRDGNEFEYFEDPVKTTLAKCDGFFTAGDYGRLDKDGWLFICDRRSDLIISGGVNIYPAEIEAVLMEHAAVADVAVFGLPDDEWGQRVQAVVEPAAGAPPADILRAELLALSRQRLAAFKLPRGISFDALPRTDAGKIARSRVRDQFLARGKLGMTGMSVGRRVCLFGSLALASLPRARAETYPARTITFIVPFTPGAAPDVFVRALAREVARQAGGVVSQRMV